MATVEDQLFGSELGAVVARSGALRQVRAGQYVPVERASNALWIVRQGMLVSAVTLADGRRGVMALHMPGDILTAPGAQHGSSRIEAMTNAEVRVVSLAALDDDGHARQLAGALLRVLEETAARARLHALRLARLSGEERLATFLVEIAAGIGRRLADRIDVSLPLGRDDIADYLGLNADTVSRLLSRLRREGIIAFDGRSMLHILDWTRLEAGAPLGEATWMRRLALS